MGVGPLTLGASVAKRVLRFAKRIVTRIQHFLHVIALASVARQSRWAAWRALAKPSSPSRCDKCILKFRCQRSSLSRQNGANASAPARWPLLDADALIRTVERGCVVTQAQSRGTRLPSHHRHFSEKARLEREADGLTELDVGASPHRRDLRHNLIAPPTHSR